MLRAVDLATASRRQLEDLAAGGRPFAAGELAGFLYHGISLNLPAWIVRLTWSKFGKAFHRDGDRGWNVRMFQDGLDRPWRPSGQTFGHFRVVEKPEHVLLDYGRAALRDPLVALDGTRLLLGWSYLALGPLKIPTPSYFVLERASAL